MSDAMTAEDVDMIEAFDRIEPIGVRAAARTLAFIAAALGRMGGSKDAVAGWWWPEDAEQPDSPVKIVTPDQAAMMFRLHYGI